MVLWACVWIGTLAGAAQAGSRLSLEGLAGAPAPGREPDLCKAAVREAAARTGVPEDVLLAISLTETGTKRDGRFDVWPWTVNMEGKGAWFASRAEALDFVERSQAAGARSFDVGCFQLNHRWHGQHFASVDAMFDPMTSAMYAAQFLAGLHAETGSWEQAAGLYHSRTPDLAARYAAMFAKHRANAQTRIAGGETDAATTGPLRMAAADALLSAGAAAAVVERINDYPLLQRGHSGQMGSLVPLGLLTGRGHVLDTPGAEALADARL